MRKLIIDAIAQKVAIEEIHEDLTGISDGRDGNEDSEGLDIGLENELLLSLEQLTETIEEELKENQKVIDISDNLLDTAEVIQRSDSEQLTPTEKGLIAVSSNMAVAGTDEHASIVSPSFEAYNDKVLAIEELQQKYKIANENIFDSIQNVTNKFLDLIKGFFSFVVKIENRIKQYSKRLSDLKNSKQTKITLEFKKSKYFKKNETEYITDFKDYSTSLKDSIDFFGKFAPLAVKSIGDFEGSLAKYITTLPGTKKTFEAAAALYESYIDGFVKSTISLPGMQKLTSDEPDIDLYRSKFMLGAAAVFVRKYKNIAVADAENVAEMKSSIYNSTVMFEKANTPFSDLSKQFFGKISLEASVDDLSDILNETTKALAIYKNFLDKAYKTFKKTAMTEGPKLEYNGRLMSLHTLIVNKGINNAIMYVSYANNYSKILCSAPLDVVERFINSSKWNAK